MLSHGGKAWWDAAGRCARCAACVECSGDPPSDPWAGLDPGQRGSRRPVGAEPSTKAKRLAREDRIRSRHPVLGGLVLAVTDEPASITAWRTGAAGERRVGRRLDALAETGHVEVLHDRALPGSRANFDHLVVGPSGIFVVDARKYQGKVEARRNGSWPGPEPDRLFVAGRDRSHLVEAMARQVDDIRGGLRRLYADPPVEVIPVLCLSTPIGRSSVLRRAWGRFMWWGRAAWSGWWAGMAASATTSGSVWPGAWPPPCRRPGPLPAPAGGARPGRVARRRGRSALPMRACPRVPPPVHVGGAQWVGLGDHLAQALPGWGEAVDEAAGLLVGAAGVRDVGGEHESRRRGPPAWRSHPR